MIKAENLVLAKRGNVDLNQRIQVECDTCGNHFESVLRNLFENKKTYGADLCRSCKQRVQYSNGAREQQRNTLIRRNKSSLGKSSEEIRGVEKTTLMKARMSAKSAGEKNPNFGGKYSKWGGAHKWHQERSGQTLEQKYGNKRGSNLRLVRSVNARGSNNPMYGKPSPQGSGNGWSGWFKGFFFRSLLELSYIKSCVDAGIEIQSAESMKFRIDYNDGMSRTYFPDYYLPNTNEIIEVKPSKLVNTKTNSAKFEAAKRKYGDKFKILTERDVHRLSNQDLVDLRQSGVIKFTNRYEQKFKEKYDNES